MGNENLFVSHIQKLSSSNSKDEEYEIILLQGSITLLDFYNEYF